MGASASQGCRSLVHGGGEPHQVVVVSTEILRVAGLPGYHTSVVLGDREYFFDREGIVTGAPGWSHANGPPGKSGKGELGTLFTHVGWCRHTGRALIETLTPFFEPGTYDIFYKNCNTFSDMALYFLLGARLDGRFNRIERLITSTDPVSVSLINMTFRAFVQHSTGTVVDADIYTMNPEAEHFSINEVIARLDEETASDDDDDDDSDESSADSERRRGCDAAAGRRTGSLTNRP